MNLFVDKIQINNGYQLQFFTEYDLNNDLKIRGHPFYNKEAWQDWVFIHNNNMILKVQILLFVTIPTQALKATINTPLLNVKRVGTYAFVHQVLQENTFPKKT